MVKNELLISVVIVNWNSGRQLYDAVSSIIEFGAGYVESVVVVDNASDDNSLELLKELPESPLKLSVIESKVNLGFGKACNLGAAHIKSEYILFLNPDCCIFSDSLSVPLQFMELEENKLVGICGIQLLDDNHISRSCSRSPTSLGLLCHAIGIDRLFPGGGQAMRDWDHLSSRTVDQVIGAFFLVRHCLFDILNGFDERFFVYYEEVDFSYRAKKIGFSSYYLTETKAYHAGGGTSRQVKAKRLFYSLRSRIQYAFKHFNIISASVVFGVTILVEPISRISLCVIRRDWQGVVNTVKAYELLLRDLSNFLLVRGSP